MTFVVEQTLSGHATDIKEPVLAMEVFDRSSDYDPKVDTIVRVEARRLRMKLAEYYASVGADEPIRIELPVGSYVPAFHVRTPPPAQNATSIAPPGKRTVHRFRFWTVVLSLAATAAAAALTIWLYRRHASPPAPRLAVLPFQDLNPQGIDELYSDGVTEALITDLAGIRRLQVISRTSVMRFKNTREPLRAIAAQLQVDYVVEGSFQRNRDQCRITAQLIRTADDVHVWAKAYDLPFTDILRVQRNVAAEIVSRVNVVLDPSDRQALDRPPPANAEAYEDLLQARRNSYRYLFQGNQDYYDEADRQIQRSLALEPGYVDAILERGLLYSRRYQNTGDPQWRAKAEDSLLAVLGREPCHAVANALMASIRNDDGDVDDAMRYARRAVDCSPNAAQAHNSLGLIYLSMGFLEAAATEFRASSHVDPVFLSPVLNLSGDLVLLHQKGDALAAAKRAVGIEPGSALALAILGLTWMDNGNLVEAHADWEKAAGLLEPALAPAIRDLFQGLEDASRGRMEASRELLRRHRGERWLQSVLWRAFYQRLVLMCEEPPEVIALIETTPELRNYRFLISSDLARLRSEPAFADLLGRRYQQWREQVAKYGSGATPAPPKLPPPDTVIRHISHAASAPPPFLEQSV